MKKVPDGAQGTKKGMEFHWLNKVFRLPAAKVRKSHICGKSWKSFPLILQKNKTFTNFMNFS